MKVYTGNWDYKAGSPCRLDKERDFHTDSHKMLIVPAQDPRPLAVLSPKIAMSQPLRVVQETPAKAGEIDFTDLLFRLRPFALAPFFEDRMVTAGSQLFDALQIWGLCMAVFGYQGKASWAPIQMDTGHGILFVADGWRGAVMGLCGGDSKGTVLP